MTDLSDKPKLRQVEAFPVETDEGTLICLRDPSGISDRMVTVSPGAVVVLEMLDGSNTLRDIQVELTRQAGQLVTSEPILKMVTVLDEAMLLEGERFEAFRDRLYADFASSTVREPTSAGGAYPDDAEELRAFLDDVLTEAPKDQPRAALRGLIAPHIDYLRGHATYAAAFGALDPSTLPGLVVILGTAHAFTTHPFALTRKDFLTPLGLAETDREFVEALGASGELDLFADEFVHRAEHSVELALLFVQRLAERAGRELRIVPVICGGTVDAVQREVSPGELPGVAEFIHVLRSEIEERAGGALIVAAADLSHVGPRFGGEELVNEQSLREVDRADRETLAFVERGDAEGFFNHVALDSNARNVCGVAPIYTLLKTLNPDSARLLRYEQSAEDDGMSAVTFAAVAVE